MGGQEGDGEVINAVLVVVSAGGGGEAQAAMRQIKGPRPVDDLGAVNQDLDGGLGHPDLGVMPKVILGSAVSRPL